MEPVCALLKQEDATSPLRPAHAEAAYTCMRRISFAGPPACWRPQQIPLLPQVILAGASGSLAAVCSPSKSQLDLLLAWIGPVHPSIVCSFRSCSSQQPASGSLFWRASSLESHLLDGCTGDRADRMAVHSHIAKRGV